MTDATPVESLFPDTPEAAPPPTPAAEVMSTPVTPPKERTHTFEDNTRRMLIEHENGLAAAAQFTQPDVESHKEHYLGDAEFDDKNLAWFRDKDGARQPAIGGKHVLLRDPEDGKYKVYERDEDTNFGPVWGRLVGMGRLISEGLTGGTMPIKSTLSKGAQAIRAVQDLKQATGETVDIPKVALTNSVIKENIGRMATHIPGGSKPFEAAAENMRSGLGGASDAAATLETPVVGNAEVAGDLARESITNTIKPGGELAQKVGGAFDKASTLVNPAHTSPMENSLQTAQRIQSRFEETRRSGLAPTLSDKALSILEPITDPRGVSFEGLKRLRHEVGEIINGHNQVPEGMQMGDVKELWGSIKDDMRALAARSGSRAAKAVDNAYAAAEVASRQREKLQTVLGGDARSDEQIFGRIMKIAQEGGDAKTLALAKRSVTPETWEAIKSATIGRLGWKIEGTERTFDPNKFMRDYGKMSEAGKNILFGTDSAHRTALDKIAEISGHWDKVKEFTQPAGEMAHLVTLGMAVGEEGGRFAKVMGAALGATTAAKLLARPATARSTAKFMQNMEQLRLNPTPATLAAANRATKAWTSDAADEFRDQTDTAAGAIEHKMAGFAATLIGAFTGGR